MPAFLIRILPLAILLFLGLRYFLIALKPRMFKIDYFMIDEAKETLLNKMEYLKLKIGFKEKPTPEPEQFPPVQDNGYTVQFRHADVKVKYRKGEAMSNIFLVISLLPELHAQNRFAEGRAGLITLKNAARLKQKYPELLTPRGLRAHIDDEDVEKYYLLYPPQKAAILKASLKETHKAMFNGTERIHIQLKGQMLEYQEGWIADAPLQTPITAKLLYLEQAVLIQAYNTAKPPADEDLAMTWQLKA